MSEYSVCPAVSFRDIRVVAQEIDPLLTLEVDDAEILPRLHDARPGLAGRNDFIENRISRHGGIP